MIKDYNWVNPSFLKKFAKIIAKSESIIDGCRNLTDTLDFLTVSQARYIYYKFDVKSYVEKYKKSLSYRIWTMFNGK